VQDLRYQTVKETAAKLFRKITKYSKAKIAQNNFKTSIEYLSQNYSQEYPHIEPIQSSKKINTKQNPFTIQIGRLEDINQIFGREKELSRIFELLNQNSSVVLIGEEGVGKSSLLWAVYQKAETLLKSPRQPVFLDLNLIQNEDEFYSELCLEINIPENSRGVQFNRGIRNQRILLAIDNVGKLTWEGFTRNIRDHLRGLAEGENASLRLVLAAPEPLDKLFNDSQENGKTSPLAIICQEEIIKPWSRIIIRDFITTRLANTSIRFTETEISEIMQKSAGNPRKVMQMCYQTYSKYLENLD
jgi:hypothetical protein